MKTLLWQVTEADCDGFGHVNNVVYLQKLEQAAWAHSDDLGMGMDTYRRLGVGCVVRRHELDYLLPCFAGDTLHVQTWILENNGKASMWRGYQIWRGQRLVLQGKTLWACVDMTTGKAVRQPPVFVAAYQTETTPAAF
jgi:acyl-CoA thioester hydrolase